MRLYTSKDNHRERTAAWAERIRNMDSIEWPKSFNQDANIKGKYNRFTEFTKEWLHGLLSGDPAKKDITGGSLVNERVFHHSLAPNWWKLAIKKGGGWNIVNGLPNRISKYDRDEFCDHLLPAYRAIKESFDNRPWYQWFTNHSQYTAERDALKAIKGIAMAMAFHNIDTFDQYYEEYCETVPLEVEKVEAAPQEIANAENQEVKAEVKEEAKEEAKEEIKQAIKEDAKQDDKVAIGGQLENDIKEDNSKNEPAVIEDEPVKMIEKLI